MALDTRAIKDEILNFLRDKLNSSDPLNRVVVQTTTVTATASQTLFELSSQYLSFVRSVTVDGTPLTFGSQYSIIWRDTNQGYVQLVSALSGGETVVIVWGKALEKKNFVYPDYPRTDLGENTYPRVGFNIFSGARVAGLGGGLDYPMAYNTTVSIKVIHTDQAFVDNMEKVVTDFIERNAKNFYNFRFINPDRLGSYSLYEDSAGNVISKTLDFTIPDQYQTITYA